MKKIENRIAKLLNTDVNNLTIIQQEDNQYLVSTKSLKNYIYDENKDAVLDMDIYNNIDRSDDQEKFLTEEEKTEYYLENQGLIGFALKKINVIDGIEQEELKDVCIYGFVKALTTFNKKAGIKFSTYSVKCMLNEMYYYLRKEQRKIQKNMSFDKQLSTDKDGNSLTVGDLISDMEYNYGKSAEAKVINDELRGVLYDCLSRLEDDEQFLIINRYGLEDGVIMTQSKIAEHLKMSQANISKLEKTCLRKMRLIMKKLHYSYNAKSKKLLYSQDDDFDFGADNKFNNLNRNDANNVSLIACEKLKLDIDEVDRIEETDMSNIFHVFFKQNTRVYGIVNTVTEQVELHMCKLSNEDIFMSFVLCTPYINNINRTVLETDKYNITYSTDELKNALSTLTKQESYVLKNIYGLFQDNCMTVGQLSDNLNLTVDEVIKIKNDAYKKIIDFM